MKRLILILMSVVTLVAIGFLIWQSQLVQKTPTPSASNPPTTTTNTNGATLLGEQGLTSSPQSKQYTDENISFFHPSNWEVRQKECVGASCSIALSLQQNSQVTITINPGSDPVNGQPLNSVQEYLTNVYPDKTIISERQSADNKVTLYTTAENNDEVMLQLPTSKNIVTLRFGDNDGSRDLILNSLTIVE